MALKALRTALTDLFASSLNEPLIEKGIDIDIEVDRAESSTFTDVSIGIGDDICSGRPGRLKILLFFRIVTGGFGLVMRSEPEAWREPFLIRARLSAPRTNRS